MARPTFTVPGMDPGYEASAMQFGDFVALDVDMGDYNHRDDQGVRSVAGINLDLDTAEAFANKILEYIAEARR